MQTFWTWLLTEDRRDLVPPAVLRSYEQAFRQALEQVIQRTKDSTLRATFQKMLDCPITDRKGNCRPFTSYIVDALIKNGIHQQYDMEAALEYVLEKMMMPTTDAGKQRPTVFADFDETRPFEPGDNPLQARFMSFLKFAINNIRKGKIPRLAKVEPRPASSLSIGLGGTQDDDPSQGISPEHLPAQSSTDADFGEIVADIVSNLRQREAAYGLPLVDVFQAMLSGQKSEALRKAYGDRAARTARQVILQTIEGYARQSENYALMRLVQRFQAGEPNRATSPPPRPKLEPGKEKDFASIVSVIDRLGRPYIGSSELGKYRRRWLEYPPRDPSSDYRNRLEEVLALMVQDGVLKAAKTAKGAWIYSPGPNFDNYRFSAIPG